MSIIITQIRVIITFLFTLLLLIFLLKRNLILDILFSLLYFITIFITGLLFFFFLIIKFLLIFILEDFLNFWFLIINVTVCIKRKRCLLFKLILFYSNYLLLTDRIEAIFFIVIFTLININIIITFVLFVSIFIDINFPNFFYKNLL